MRRVLMLVGAALVATAVGITLAAWNTVVDPGARQRTFDQIRVGMTDREVVALLGEGQFRSFRGPGSFGPGQPVPASARTCFAETRWDDAHAIVDVEFQNGVVTRITRSPKGPPEYETLQVSRDRLAHLALGGVCLLALGLCMSPTRPAVDATATSPPSA